MTVREQVNKLKDNWLLILLPLLLLFIFAGGLSGIFSLFSGLSSSGSSSSADYYESPSMGYSGDYGASPAPYAAFTKSSASSSSALDQMIAKTASMETKVERTTFLAAEATLKSIVTSSDAAMLDQNVQTYGEGIAEYRAGRYQIKVDAKKYDAVVSQLKAIGEIETFTENAADVTKAYTDLGVQLANEKTRLERYNVMYEDATLVADKIDLSDRIFNQENTIKYLEEYLKNVGDQVVYSTVDVTITEKQSGYAELAFVKLSDLVKGFVSSLSTVIYLLVILVPWALGIWLVLFVIRKLRGKKK